jgi:hypothetical protein
MRIVVGLAGVYCSGVRASRNCLDVGRSLSLISSGR